MKARIMNDFITYLTENSEKYWEFLDQRQDKDELLQQYEALDEDFAIYFFGEERDVDTALGAW